MKFVSTQNDSFVNEVLIRTHELSRFGEMSLDECIDFSKNLKSQGKHTVLDWDILMVEAEFLKVLEILKRIDVSHFDAIRVQDAGALMFVKENFPNTKIHLNLETGNHNLVGIKKWIELAGENLSRVVLSIELSKDTIKKYVKEINVETELLALGPILLFYSPRKLLSPLYGKTINERSSEVLETLAESEESAHKGFRVVENKHGSFMFNTKDLNLLSDFESLKDCGIDFLRIDLNHLKQDEQLNIKALIENNRFSEIKNEYPISNIKGFFNINKSDVLFKKLKNHRLVKKDDSFVGSVLDVSKGNYIGFQLKSQKKINIGDRVKISKVKSVFEKGYLANWTEEEFFVDEINEKFSPLTYKLIDYHGNRIDGSFYRYELQKVKRDDDVFLVEKIISRRRDGNQTWCLVKWVGYPSTFNSWIAESDIQTVNENEVRTH